MNGNLRTKIVILIHDASAVWNTASHCSNAMQVDAIFSRRRIFPDDQHQSFANSSAVPGNPWRISSGL